MKHIRKFKESLNINITELQNFCNDNLAYLIDDGFKVKCTSHRTFKESGYYSRVGINKPYNIYNWYDVRDDIIPFISTLSKEYNILPYVYFYISTEAGHRDKMIKLDDIVNDRLENYEIVSSITFRIEKY